MKEKSKAQKKIPKRKVFLELLYQRLGHRSKRSLLDGDIECFGQDIELRVYPDPFYIPCQISTINKRSRSKTPLKSNTYFKWLFIDIIPATSYKSFKKYTTFSNYLLIVDAYSKIPKLYGMEHFTTEEMMDKIDMFQAIFGKLCKSGWWDMDIIQTDDDRQFTSKEFQEGPNVCGLWLALATTDHQ